MYAVDSVEKNSLRSRQGRESSGWEHVGEAIGPGRCPALGGGRTWWAHFESTRINIEPIILKNKIEDLRDARTTVANTLFVLAPI